MTDSESSNHAVVPTNPFLSLPPRTVDAMSCTPIPDPLRDLLATVAAHPGVPVDRLDPEQLYVAFAYCWRTRTGDGPG